MTTETVKRLLRMALLRWGSFGWRRKGCVCGGALWVVLCALDSTHTLWLITLHTLFFAALALSEWRAASVLSARIVSRWRRSRKILFDDVASSSSVQQQQQQQQQPTVQSVRPGLFAAAFVAAAVLRAFVVSGPGFCKWVLANACASSLMLLYGAVVPTAVIVMCGCVGWLLLTLLWLAPEICKSTAAAHGICNVFWKYQVLIVFLVCGVALWRYYRAVGLTSFVRHVVLCLLVFPPSFLFLFGCTHWTLISVAPFWMHVNDPYTKGTILSYLPEENLLGNHFIIKHSDLDAIPDSLFPIIMKPDECTGANLRVCPIETRAQAEAYFRAREGWNLERRTLAQRYHRGGYEATFWYYRWPFASHGKLKTVWFKNFTQYAPRMKSCRIVQQMAPAPHWNEYYFHIRNPFSPIRDDLSSDPILVDHFDRLAKRIPYCTAARFDVKYDSEELLRKGIFYVLEVELAPFGDRRERSFDCDEYYSSFSNAARQSRTLALQMTIGALNIMMGHTLDPLPTLARTTRLVEISEKCRYDGSMWPITPGKI